MINDTDTDNNMGGGDGVQKRAQPTTLSPSNNNTTSITVVQQHSPRSGDFPPPPFKNGDPTGPLSPSSPFPPHHQWQAADWMLLLTMLLLVVGTVQVVAMGGFFSGGSGNGDFMSLYHERIAKLESRASLLSDSVRNTTMDIGVIFEELRALENVPAYRAALDEARADASSTGGANVLKTPKGKRAVEELNRLHQAAVKEVGRIHAMVVRAQKSYMEYYHEKEEEA